MRSPEFITLDEASQRLHMPWAEVAHLILQGRIGFVLKDKAANRFTLGSDDILVRLADVEAWDRWRWGDVVGDRVVADRRVNTAAMKYNVHPTREGRGTRGPGKKGGQHMPRTSNSGSGGDPLEDDYFAEVDPAEAERIRESK